jgi:4-alpha-glucanotransferase
MDQARRSGVLLHPTSLPGRYGIGDLGDEAYRFVDFLHSAKQSLWQVLPLGPTGYADSPYASFSSHAGNPLLVDLTRLVEAGDLSATALGDAPHFPSDHVDYGSVIDWKTGMLRQAARRFRSVADRAQRAAFERFCDEKAHWLEDYALFMALKEAHDGAMWNTWEPPLVQRDPQALAARRAALDEAIHFHKYAQYRFFEQWRALRSYANEQGILLVGDIPIFVAPDSADAWANPEIFYMDQQGHLTVVAGVPPDYFSETGQRWGNPLYRWDVIAADGFRWWIQRLRSVLELVDILRIDHFRGLETYWEIPADEPTAVHGRWVPGPSDAFFDALKVEFGPELPIIAEDLGIITDAVRALRKRVGLPGMKVLHFAFSGGPEHEYLPHNYEQDYVVYLGTHDNDTTIGWYNSRDEREQSFVLRYLGRDGRDIVWSLMQLAFMSVASMAVVTAQDLLRLGSEARMNTPGTTGANWQWRYAPGALTDDIARWLGELTATYGRATEEDADE